MSSDEEMRVPRKVIDDQIATQKMEELIGDDLEEVRVGTTDVRSHDVEVPSTTTTTPVVIGNNDVVPSHADEPMHIIATTRSDHHQEEPSEEEATLKFHDNADFGAADNENQEQTKEEEITETDDNATAAEEEEQEQEEELSEEEMRSKRMGCYMKVAFGLILLGFIVFVIIDSLTTGYVRDGINTFLNWIETNPAAGIFIFVFVYFVATVLFIPGSVLTLGAGFVFSAAFGLGGGLVAGAIAVFLGASLGATVAFLVGRYLLRDQVVKLTKRYAIFEALDSALEENGLKIFVLLRLSPIIPFNAINYIGGVTSVSLRDYCVALFGILPGTIVYVFLGASAGSLADSANSGSNKTVTIIVIVVGAVFGILAIWVTTRYARKELNRVIEKRRQELEAEGTASSPDEESGESGESGESM